MQFGRAVLVLNPEMCGCRHVISLLANVKLLWSSMPYPVSQPQCDQVKQEDESLANLREVNVKDIAKNEREDDGYISPEEKLGLRFEPAS